MRELLHTEGSCQQAVIQAVPTAMACGVLMSWCRQVRQLPAGAPLRRSGSLRTALSQAHVALGFMHAASADDAWDEKRGNTS